MTNSPPRRTLRIGTVGFGWMGQAHSRSYRRIPSLFPDRTFEPRLAVCADNVESRRTAAVTDFGYERAVEDWRDIVADPTIDIVSVCAPNMLHEEVCLAALAAGKHVFCEKPVGGTPPQTARIAAAARGTTSVTGVGYNYRWAPLVLHAKELIDSGRLGEITNYRGRFFSTYGSDPLGLLSWRFLVDEGGHGVSSDILSHSIDLAMFLLGPIASVTGTMETFIKERPISKGTGTHYDRGTPGDPTGTVTNEDYGACLARFGSGVRGAFEASRSMVGPESQMAFDVYGTKGALSWNLETMNEMRVFLVDESGKAPRGYTTVYAGERYPYHGRFVPGDANSIGFEDLVTIEDMAYLTSVAAGTPHRPGFEEALDYVSVQAAWLRSCESGRWEDVVRVES